MPNLTNPKKHDDLLNYRLKRLVSLGGAPAIRLCEGQYGVPRAEWRLIAALVECGPMSPTALSGATGAELARVSRLVTNLLEKRLIRRVESDADKRMALLIATDAAIKLYRDLFPKLTEINRRIVQVLSAEEARIFDRCLEKLTAQVIAIGRAGGGVPVKAKRNAGGSRRFWPA